MTDPERISKRGMGLAAELVRAGVDEQPTGASMDRTLAALGVSAAVLTSGVAAQAAVGGAKLSGAAATGVSGAVAVKATSTALVAKWIGIGVLGGVGLAGAASVATSPAAPTPSAPAAHRRPASPPKAESTVAARPSLAEPATIEVDPTPPPAPKARSSARGDSALSLPLEVGAPLAAEVAFIDSARNLSSSGSYEQALRLLAGYEKKFPSARLLPEALFLRLEACERTGRSAEARAFAAQLLRDFPKSPHAGRARKLLAR
jgi:hypothetical protein